MAYTMTFDSLQEDIRSYLERGFTEETDKLVYNQIPRLINMAERRIARELKIQGFTRAVNMSVEQGKSVYKKPDRWRDTISMAYGGVSLFTRSYDYLRSYWPVPEEEAPPRYYADYDYDHWLIAPTPDSSGVAEVLYYELPRLLDDEAQTNWLTDHAPNLLLYGALLEATPFLKNDERIQTWQMMYDRAAQALNGEDLQKIMDRNAMRSGV